MNRLIPVIWMVSLIVGTAPAAAQEGRTQQDSILIQLRQLLRRVDSLERMLDELRAAGRDTAGPVDELAALRAAAREAAGAGGTRADTAAAQESRTRNLSLLNPEIRVSGDIVGGYAAPGGSPNTTSATP
ncbi:MAG: hypothetical protein ACYSVY_28200, partial [Planctomycetota bacterium]